MPRLVFDELLLLQPTGRQQRTHTVIHINFAIMLASYHMELFLEQNRECRAMERRRQHMFGMPDETQIMVRRSFFKKMEAILLKSKRFIAREHHIHR